MTLLDASEAPFTSLLSHSQVGFSLLVALSFYSPSFIGIAAECTVSACSAAPRRPDAPVRLSGCAIPRSAGLTSPPAVLARRGGEAALGAKSGTRLRDQTELKELGEEPIRGRGFSSYSH